MNTMTIDQKQILLSARKDGLKSIQNCMSEAHHFPMTTVKAWWEEARAKVVEIEKIELEINDEIEAQS